MSAAVETAGKWITAERLGEGYLDGVFHRPAPEFKKRSFREIAGRQRVESLSQAHIGLIGCDMEAGMREGLSLLRNGLHDSRMTVPGIEHGDTRGNHAPEFRPLARHFRGAPERRLQGGNAPLQGFGFPVSYLISARGPLYWRARPRTVSLAGKLSKDGNTTGTADTGSPAAAPLSCRVARSRHFWFERRQPGRGSPGRGPSSSAASSVARPEPVVGNTMRTPGDDESLAAGLLYGEGIVSKAADIEALESSTRRPNVINVRLHPRWSGRTRPLARRPSCGSAAPPASMPPLPAAATRIPDTGPTSLGLLMQLPNRMRAAQSKFGYTGGVHASALFDFSGNLLNLAEDVGRHNAFDKLVGMSLMSNEVPLSNRIVVLSGRASFELVQKALRAGVSILAAIGAPSSLAVNLAVTSGLTLVGFLRESHCNVYAHPGRLTLDAAPA
jgi:FdhD protein